MIDPVSYLVMGDFCVDFGRAWCPPYLKLQSCTDNNNTFQRSTYTMLLEYSAYNDSVFAYRGYIFNSRIPQVPAVLGTLSPSQEPTMMTGYAIEARR